ncbi:NUDIX hydrolase [Halovivax cerinus]|uniref:NUDIX hydrolase n=1 Tax=Halovivax cerinus TaxID=1487865 RepID=A0ABD5NSM6_9EURY|nr:NUDIX hydrolase [Halovivax cerinus]
MLDAYGYVVNVDGAVVRDGEYLFIERGVEEAHAAETLAFPGGTLESPPGTDDPIADTVRRELREEVGIEVGRVSYVCSSVFEMDGGTPCLNVVTLCEYAGGEARPRDPDEVAAVHWLSIADLHARADAPPYLLEYVDRVEAARATP